MFEKITVNDYLSPNHRMNPGNFTTTTTYHINYPDGTNLIDAIDKVTSPIPTYISVPNGGSIIPMNNVDPSFNIPLNKENIEEIKNKKFPECKEIEEFSATIPSYYGGKDLPYNPINFIRYWNLNFNLGSCIKYFVRRGKKAKETEIEDLEKCIVYLQNEIKYLKENT